MPSLTPFTAYAGSLDHHKLVARGSATGFHSLPVQLQAFIAVACTFAILAIAMMSGYVSTLVLTKWMDHDEATRPNSRNPLRGFLYVDGAILVFVVTFVGLAVSAPIVVPLGLVLGPFYGLWLLSSKSRRSPLAPPSYIPSNRETGVALADLSKGNPSSAASADGAV
ncbi:hypothetical protein ACHAQH_000133 [Verticillium albo-atrum]